MTAAEEVRACCAAMYDDPEVRWLLGDSLHPGGLALTNRLLRALDLTARSALLDIACGTGASGMRAFEVHGCQVIGLDFSERMIAQATAASPSPRVSFRVADADALPLPADSVDAVLCECSLCLFPEPEQALAEAARVLRPGGRIAVSDMSADPARLPASLRTLAGVAACLGAARPLAATAELVSAAGFEVEAVEDASAGLDEMLATIEDRLRLASMIRGHLGAPVVERLDAATGLVADARGARDAGVLGYGFVVAAKNAAVHASIDRSVASNGA